MRSRRAVIVPRPERVRSPEGISWAWIDTRIKQDGWLSVLSRDALAVYLFLCLAADRSGVSFYRRERIGRELGLGDQELWRALKRLYELELVAYTPFGSHSPDGFHQVLALLDGGPPAPKLALELER